MTLKEYQAAIKAQNEYASECYKKREFLMTPEQEQAELCKLSEWSDQISLGIFYCAECKKSVCECNTPSSLGKLDDIEYWRCGGKNQREGRLRRLMQKK